ncbi:muts domain V-domain-containing protein [Roridomyces roridus]|uniref:DNA mismatch repair protein MSH3 n=1 Tax=Roridomyces roridus TaxID=1738132 RepID=A0AAD7FQE8_9AGAR|nr:muts domain V-domain-containing protein [Roridomyces roridus]
MSQSRISAYFSPTKSPGKRRLESPTGEPSQKKQKADLEQWRFTPSPEKSTTPRKASRQSKPKPVESPIVISDSDSEPSFTKLTRSKTTKRSKNSKKELGPSGEPWTPMEKQVRQLKQENPGVVLMVEVGYKYRFFGEDAKVAAKELGMVCYRDRNYLTASVPYDRREIHLKKPVSLLLSQGYKVGIVAQVETAALKKAGENSNTPFERKLVQLFTATTYVDEIDSLDHETDKYTSPRLVCIIEGKGGKPGTVPFGIISVAPSVGDVVWDAFDGISSTLLRCCKSRIFTPDTPMCIELETRLAHTKPSELLLPKRGLSKNTAKVLDHLATSSARTSGAIRKEYFEEEMTYTEAFDFVSSFYEKAKKANLVATITDFPKLAVIALACAIRYLSAFDIAATLAQTTFFTKFTTKTHMLLAGNTLANLEIFQNETDYTTRGSLVWILDKTVTKFGARMLRSWIGRPLVDKSALQERIDAVEEIITSSSEHLAKLRQLLRRLPDLAKGLSRIQYKQCTPRELAVLLPAFQKIGDAFANQPIEDLGLESRLLKEIISALPPLKGPMSELVNLIDLEQAAEGKKENMWTDPTQYPELEDFHLGIQTSEAEIEQELVAIRKTLRMPSLKYTTIAGEEYLIEVKKADKRPIPAEYLPAISKTKFYERYRSPTVKRKMEERALFTESLQARVFTIEARKAYSHFLEECVGKHYAVMRDAVNKLATADCLISLAQVALQENYVKPEFTDEPDTLEIDEGRHPMIEALRSDPFIPNTISFLESRSKVITGPNMGGKSSCVRMIALIAIMAQIGSYVPAASVKLAPLDSIQTRMGASDDIARGRSTFMIEMTETSEILQTAGSESLVVLDELGRGTSTFDGMSIAYAVLQQLATQTRCKTLFITHYPLVGMELEEKFPETVHNMHVGYRTENKTIDGRRDVQFLYKLERGIAKESFGVECARLAGLPESILDRASEKSSNLEKTVTERTKRNMVIQTLQILKGLSDPQPQSQAETTVEILRSSLRSLTTSP